MQPGQMPVGAIPYGFWFEPLGGAPFPLLPFAICNLRPPSEPLRNS